MIVDVHTLRIQRLTCNSNVLALEEIQRGAGRRRQELAALIIRERADLPVLGRVLEVFWYELRFGNRVDGVEVQILGRNLLELPRRALGIEEVLALWLHEALAPGVGAASLQPVREALGRLDLQRVVLGTAGWGIRVENAAVLGEWVKCARQRIGHREAGIRRDPACPDAASLACTAALPSGCVVSR